MAGTKHRHHIVPRFYLAGFTDESAGRLSVYSKPDARGLRTTPTNAAVRIDYCAAELTTGERNSDLIEDALAKVEEQAAPALRKLLRQEPLTELERDRFSYFLGIAMVRGPDFREQIQAYEEGWTKSHTSLLASNPVALENSLKKYERQRGMTLSAE